MTWSYSGNPADSPKDAVRFEIGDTNQEDQLISDEEINYCLASEKNTLAAAARCCEVIARKFARQADKAIGRTRIAASQKSKAYRELAKQLRNKVTAYSGIPYEYYTACGVEVESIFTKGMTDNI